MVYSGFGQAGEFRQRRQGHVHAQRPGCAAVGLHAIEKIRLDVAWLDQIEKQQFRIHVRRDRARRDFAPVAQDHAARPPVPDQELGHFGVAVDGDAAQPRLRGDRIADRAHAADGVAPLPGLAVHFAENMMQQHVGRARRVRTGEVSDHGIEAERGLERRRFEPCIEQIAGAVCEQRKQIALGRQRQPVHAAHGFERRDNLGQAAADIRRRFQRQPAQHLRRLLQHGVVRGQALGIALRIPRDLRLRRGETAADLEMRTGFGRQRQKVRDRPFDDPQPMAREVEVGDDLRMQQADGVARRGVAESRMELLRYGGAADDGAAFEHPDRETGPGQIAGADETVVAAADYDDIGAVHGRPHALHQSACSARSAGRRPSVSGSTSSTTAAMTPKVRGTPIASPSMP